MDIKKQIIKKIKKYNKIIIHRHSRPDMDAIGSQYGLYLLIKENFPQKEVYVVGDTNDMVYEAKMDDIKNHIYDEALVIITDVSVSNMVSDDRYNLAREIIIIDHHRNETDIKDVSIFYKDPTFSSACELIIDLAKTAKYKISEDAATFLYAGMITDTGRFLYLDNSQRTFSLAAYITKFNPRIQQFYNFLYTESLEKKKAKALFADFELTKNNVAYRKNTDAMVKESKMEFQSVSRGMVNQMAGITGVYIWASFTEDSQTNKIIAEFRSRDVIIVDIAIKHGGGGHNHACGASFNNWDEVDLALKDLDERAEEHAKNIKQN